MSEFERYKLVEDNIEIRLNPSIYAFSTNTIPSYLKVGDTFRAVDTRIDEWRSILVKRLRPRLIEVRKEYEHSALVKDDLYFRDYSVHKYLENILNKKRITDADLLNLYSQEYFKDTTIDNLNEAIKAIEEDCLSDNIEKQYTFYKTEDGKGGDFHYLNDKKWEPRPNQKVVIDNFLSKTEESSLLMFAVMRFGKSFTAMRCALESGAKKVLIVSAKADVLREWQKTVEMPECFKDYNFLCDKDFKNDVKLNDIINSGEKNNIAVFLTLQNLSGKSEDGEDIKNRLKQVFSTEFDLIIVDETHYGAWANSYGKPLKDSDEEYLENELKEKTKFINETNKLKGKQKLHLSGTPYNLLYDNKFNVNNIIATCQFKDILEDKEKWDNEHFLDIENGKVNDETGYPYQEFDNPYFGFPKMLRFAFNLPQSAKDVLNDAKKNGKNWSLSELFKTKVSDKEATFIYEQEVLKLLKVIDGADKEDEILSFLDVPKIKDNDVCKHMVFVLPFKYSCDALEQLLEREKESFINLSKFNILNITGHNVKPELNDVDKVKLKIAECEKNGEKTITLTVNKMLTGVTVKEWDTMVMLKSTKSPQEYDQAVFRIQNQYVLEYSAKDGSVIKKDMKPQTILVDFDPIRMFELQGLSTQIVNKVKDENKSLNDSIFAELKFFPIITYNAKQLVKVEPTNIIEIITKYNNQKSIMDEVQSIEMDEKLLEDLYIKNFINTQSKLDLSNKQKVEAHSGATKDIDTGINIENFTDENHGGSEKPDSESNEISQNKKDTIKRYRMCIAGLSFYAFLTKSNIDTLQDVLSSVQDENENLTANKRIFQNLNLDERFIEEHIIQCARFSAMTIDNVVNKSNMLSKDEKLSEEQRAKNALNRFSRISDSEIVTPLNICFDMLNCIGVENLVKIVNSGNKILDIAGKTGEFTFALYNLLKDRVDIEKLNNAIYTIPTSTVTYEFTRRMYEVLGLNIANIAEKFNSYDIISVVKKETQIDYDKVKLLLTQNKPFNAITMEDVVKEGEEKVKFDAIIGNPPYQEKVGNGDSNASLGKQLFPYFVSLSLRFKTKFVSLITPSRWFAGDAQDKSFVKLREFVKVNNHFRNICIYPNTSDVFDNVVIKGGINYFLYEKEYNGSVNFTRVTKNIVVSHMRPLFEDGMEIIISNTEMFSIIKKVLSFPQFKSITEITKGRNAFGIIGKQSIVDTISHDAKFFGAIELRCKSNVIRWTDRNSVTKNAGLVDKYKIYISKSAGDPSADQKIIGIPYLGRVGSVCTDSLIPIGKFDTINEAKNLQKYMLTKFLRFMISTLKVSQNVCQNVYKHVPLQDFTVKSEIDWSKSIAEIDKQLYAKYGLDEAEIAFIESMIKPME